MNGLTFQRQQPYNTVMPLSGEQTEEQTLNNTLYNKISPDINGERRHVSRERRKVTIQRPEKIPKEIEEELANLRRIQESFASATRQAMESLTASQTDMRHHIFSQRRTISDLERSEDRRRKEVEKLKEQHKVLSGEIKEMHSQKRNFELERVDIRKQRAALEYDKKEFEEKKFIQQQQLEKTVQLHDKCKGNKRKLKEREGAIAEREKQVENKAKRQKAFHEELQKKELYLVSQSDAVADREKHLLAWESKLQSKEDALAQEASKLREEKISCEIAKAEFTRNKEAQDARSRELLGIQSELIKLAEKITTSN